MPKHKKRVYPFTNKGPPQIRRKTLFEEQKEYDTQMREKKSLNDILKPVKPFTIDFAPYVAENQPEQFREGELVMIVKEIELHHITHCYLGELRSLKEITDLTKPQSVKYLEVNIGSHLDIRAAGLFRSQYNVFYNNMPTIHNETPQLPADDFMVKLYERAPKIMGCPAFGIRKVDGLLMPGGRFVEYNKKTPQQ